MPEGNPLAIFAPGLNALGAPWMAVGSIASSAYGERRSTLDVDIVAVVRTQDATRFLAVLPETEFYCPPVDVIQAESARPERGHFNLIHHHSIYKADVYMATGSAFERWAFENRRPLAVGETPVWLAPPEYVIVHKLEFLGEGGSEKHLRDIRGMLAVTDVNRTFLQKEIAELGLSDLWRKCI